MSKSARPSREIQIIGVNIDDWQFQSAPQRHRARVQFQYDLLNSDETGTTDCICETDLPADATPEQVRDALIANAMGQLSRMPEMWLGEANLTLRATADRVRITALN